MNSKQQRSFNESVKVMIDCASMAGIDAKKLDFDFDFDDFAFNIIELVNKAREEYFRPVMLNPAPHEKDCKEYLNDAIKAINGAIIFQDNYGF